MRRLIVLLAACAALLAGLTAPALASGDLDSQTAPAAAQGQQAPDAAATGWAMGGYPNYWTICVADGVDGANGYWATLARKWTWAGHELNLVVQNRCDGYSITNRFTLESLNSTTIACAKITQAHQTWSPARGKYIWDQNPILWVNINDKCTTTPTSYDHRVQMYIGWLLGLYPDPGDCNCVMGNTTNDIYSIRYVVLHDILDQDVVYRH